MVFYCFSQEHLAQFDGVKHNQFKCVSITPVVIWPMEHTVKNKKFNYKIEVLNFKCDGLASTLQLENNCAVKIDRSDKKTFLLFETYFPPQSQQLLARLFYQLGVEVVQLNGKDVSIYNYADLYKVVAHEGLMKTRTYVK
jgi:hypothetical protein